MIGQIFTPASKINQRIWIGRIYTLWIILRNNGHDVQVFQEWPKIGIHKYAWRGLFGGHLDGKQIDVMTFPLIEAFGNDDGEYYDEGRVWMPAEVSMETSTYKSD